MAPSPANDLGQDEHHFHVALCKEPQTFVNQKCLEQRREGPKLNEIALDRLI
jgi:hypothetical protein